MLKKMIFFVILSISFGLILFSPPSIFARDNGTTDSSGSGNLINDDEDDEDEDEDEDEADEINNDEDEDEDEADQDENEKILEQQKEEVKKAAALKKEQIKKQLEAAKKIFEEQKETAKTELETNRQTAEQAVELAKAKLQTAAERSHRVSNRLGAATFRFAKFNSKIKTRLAKMKLEGIDITAFQSDLNTLNSKLAAIETQITAMRAMAADFDQDSEPKILAESVKEKAQLAILDIKSLHQEYKTLIKKMKAAAETQTETETEDTEESDNTID